MFNTKIKEFYADFKTHKNMVLSTTDGSRVHARMMSIVCINDRFYFQTDKNFQKCNDIENCPFVSLCADNYSIEGFCRKAGRPCDNDTFLELFKQSFPKSFDLYTMSENEVLYEIKPTCIKRWIYENEQPYIEIFDINSGEYYKRKYE